LSSKEQEQITKLNNDIASAQKDERYLKFSVAKNIVAQNTVV
jgi:hypothetical protein